MLTVNTKDRYINYFTFYWEDIRKEYFSLLHTIHISIEYMRPTVQAVNDVVHNHTAESKRRLLAQN